MIISMDEAIKRGAERSHIHITKALSKGIKDSNMDAKEFEKMKRKELSNLQGEE